MHVRMRRRRAAVVEAVVEWRVVGTSPRVDHSRRERPEPQVARRGCPRSEDERGLEPRAARCRAAARTVYQRAAATVVMPSRRRAAIALRHAATAGRHAAAVAARGVPSRAR